MAPKDTKNTEKDITNANFKGKEERNVPDLRFSEFETPYYKKDFYEIISIVNGQVDPNDEDYRELPHIGPGNIEKNTGFLLNYNLAYEDNLISSKYLFDSDCVIYGKINPHFAKATYPGFVGLCSADAYPLKPTNEILPYYLLQLILTKRFTKFTTCISKRTGMPKVNRDDLATYKFYVPNIKEQNKIAEFINLIDQKILTQRKIIEDILCLRSSICDNFCHYEGEKYKIMDIAEIGRGRVINSKEISQQKNPKYPVYSSQTLNNGIMGYLDNYDFDGEYITWTTDGANAGTVFYHDEKFNCTNVCGTLKITSSYVNPFYLSLILELTCKKYVSSNLANPKLMNNTMATISIIIPNEMIQYKSSKLIKSLDEKISNEKRILELYQKQKDYLLNKMFI